MLGDRKKDLTPSLPRGHSQSSGSALTTEGEPHSCRGAPICGSAHLQPNSRSAAVLEGLSSEAGASKHQSQLGGNQATPTSTNPTVLSSAPEPFYSEARGPGTRTRTHTQTYAHTRAHTHGCTQVPLGLRELLPESKRRFRAQERKRDNKSRKKSLREHQKKRMVSVK